MDIDIDRETLIEIINNIFDRMIELEQKNNYLEELNTKLYKEIKDLKNKEEV